MGKTSQTWSFMRASWQVLKMDKKMLIFPVISGICCLLVIVSFAMNVELPENDALTTSDYHDSISYLFLQLFCDRILQFSNHCMCNHPHGRWRPESL